MLKLKIVALSVMLVIVVFAMYSLNTGRIKVGFLPQAQSLSWCATRVIEIVEENPISTYRVFQENGTWFKDGTALTAPVMEKWLGSNCSLKLDQQLPPPAEMPRELGVVRIKMLNGKVQEFHRFYGGLYTYGDNLWFKSNEWDAALAELATF
jgi:hypothetical protein